MPPKAKKHTKYTNEMTAVSSTCSSQGSDSSQADQASTLAATFEVGAPITGKWVLIGISVLHNKRCEGKYLQSMLEYAFSKGVEGVKLLIADEVQVENLLRPDMTLEQIEAVKKQALALGDDWLNNNFIYICNAMGVRPHANWEKMNAENKSGFLATIKDKAAWLNKAAAGAQGSATDVSKSKLLVIRWRELEKGSLEPEMKAIHEQVLNNDELKQSIRAMAIKFNEKKKVEEESLVSDVQLKKVEVKLKAHLEARLGSDVTPLVEGYLGHPLGAPQLAAPTGAQLEAQQEAIARSERYIEREIKALGPYTFENRIPFLVYAGSISETFRQALSAYRDILIRAPKKVDTLSFPETVIGGVTFKLSKAPTLPPTIPHSATSSPIMAPLGAVSGSVMPFSRQCTPPHGIPPLDPQAQELVGAIMSSGESIVTQATAILMVARKLSSPQESVNSTPPQDRLTTSPLPPSLFLSRPGLAPAPGDSPQGGGSLDALCEDTTQTETPPNILEAAATLLHSSLTRSPFLPPLFPKPSSKTHRSRSANSVPGDTPRAEAATFILDPWREAETQTESPKNLLQAIATLLPLDTKPSIIEGFVRESQSAVSSCENQLKKSRSPRPALGNNIQGGETATLLPPGPTVSHFRPPLFPSCPSEGHRSRSPRGGVTWQGEATTGAVRCEATTQTESPKDVLKEATTTTLTLLDPNSPSVMEESFGNPLTLLSDNAAPEPISETGDKVIISIPPKGNTLPLAPVPEAEPEPAEPKPDSALTLPLGWITSAPTKKSAITLVFLMIASVVVYSKLPAPQNSLVTGYS